MRAGQASHCTRGFEMTSPLELSIALSDNERTRPLIEGRVVPQGIKPVVTVVHPHEFGVHPRDIEWFMERNPEKSHGGATGFTAPPGVRVQHIPPSTNIGEMLVRGELDGALLYLVHPNLIDRSTADVSGVTRHLFPDPADEGRRFYAKTGLFPINHTVVLRRSLLERHPWVALNLYSAFVAAKEEIARYGQSYLHWYFETGLLDAGIDRTLADNDPLAYGFKASRPVLETIAEYVHEQGLSARRGKLEELFVAR